MRFANCCPLLTLFMHFPSDLFFPSSYHSLLSLFLEIFKLALAFHLFKISQCLPNLFSKRLSSLNAWTMLQSFPSDPHLCSQLELLKPVCSNFLQSNQSGYSPFDPVNQSAILTARLSSFGFHSSTLSSMCSLENLLSHISSCGGYREAKDYLTQLK